MAAVKKYKIVTETVHYSIRRAMEAEEGKEYPLEYAIVVALVIVRYGFSTTIKTVMYYVTSVFVMRFFVVAESMDNIFTAKTIRTGTAIEPRHRRATYE